MSDDASDWTHRGMLYHAERCYFEASWCHDVAVEADPSSAFAWTARGDLLNDVLRFREALDCYDRAAAIRSDAPIIHTRRGIALQNLKSFDDALQAYDRAHVVDPSFELAKVYRSECCFVAGKYDQAIAGFEGLMRDSADAEVVQKSKLMIQETRARQGKGFAGLIRKTFSVKPPKNEWKAAVVDFVNEQSTIETYMKAGDGLFMAVLRRLASLEDGKPSTDGMSEEAMQAITEQIYNPRDVQPIVNELLLPLLRRAHEVKDEKDLAPSEREIQNVRSLEELRDEVLRYVYTTGFLSEGDEKRNLRIRAHNLFWQVELRYPGLASAIWSARGRAPFVSGKIDAALRDEPERLERLQELAKRDQAAFLESLLAWVG